jgi:hypothetical protein
MRKYKYKTKIVASIPRQLNEGILYVSVEYNIVMHRCFCGCGSEIATPLSKEHGWVLTYDGVDASIYPSIGNSAYKCKSHYWLKNGVVKWLEPIEKPKKEVVTRNKWWKKIWSIPS